MISQEDFNIFEVGKKVSKQVSEYVCNEESNSNIIEDSLALALL